MKTLTLTEIFDSAQKSGICNKILKALPDWFGVPEAVEDYTNKVADMPFLAFIEDGEAVGFLAIKRHNQYTAEVCVMGVLQAYHRQGLGRRLIDACILHCKENGYKFLTVKTLAELNHDEGYARTRKFYESVGFYPLEVFPLYWDEENPCLFMAMAL